VDLTDLCAQLRAQGVTIEPDPDREVVFVLQGPPVRQIPAFQQGLCQPQDPTAMTVVRLADPKPGQTIIDMCAAPGTKATLAAEYMGNQGIVLASDQTAEKLRLIEANCQRLGIHIVQTVQVDALASAASRLDRIETVLVDAPCSNSGVLARRPEARYRIDENALQRLAAAQIELLRRAAALARPGTRLVYSTCSIEREENEEVIQAFCREHRRWRLIESCLTLPRAGAEARSWCDGGFAAVLVREP